MCLPITGKRKSCHNVDIRGFETSDNFWSWKWTILVWLSSYGIITKFSTTIFTYSTFSSEIEKSLLEKSIIGSVPFRTSANLFGTILFYHFSSDIWIFQEQSPPLLHHHLFHIHHYFSHIPFSFKNITSTAKNEATLIAGFKSSEALGMHSCKISGGHVYFQVWDDKHVPGFYLLILPLTSSDWQLLGVTCRTRDPSLQDRVSDESLWKGMSCSMSVLQSGPYSGAAPLPIWSKLPQRCGPPDDVTSWEESWQYLHESPASLDQHLQG